MKWRVPWKVQEETRIISGVEEVLAETALGACAKAISTVRIRYGEVTVTAGPAEYVPAQHESWKDGIIP